MSLAKWAPFVLCCLMVFGPRGFILEETDFATEWFHSDHDLEDKFSNPSSGTNP